MACALPWAGVGIAVRSCDVSTLVWGVEEEVGLVGPAGTDVIEGGWVQHFVFFKNVPFK